MLDGVDESINFGAMCAGYSHLRLPACTMCIGIRLPEVSGNFGLFGNPDGSAPIYAYTVGGIVLFAIANDHMVNTTTRRARTQARTATDAIAPGQDAFIVLTFDGTAPAQGAGAGDPGMPKLYVGGADATLAVSGVSSAGSLVGSMGKEITTTYGGFLGAGAYRQIAFVEGEATPAQVAELTTLYAAKDPDAFSDALAAIGTRTLDVPVVNTDDGSDGGSLANRGTLSDATPVNTESADLVAA